MQRRSSTIPGPPSGHSRAEERQDALVGLPAVVAQRVNQLSSGMAVGMARITAHPATGRQAGIVEKGFATVGWRQSANGTKPDGGVPDPPTGIVHDDFVPESPYQH